jgi:hypothetical protein
MKWQEDNAGKISDALVMIDPKTKYASPYELMGLDPISLESVGLPKILEKSPERKREITEARKELLLSYLQIKKDIRASVKAEAREKADNLNSEEKEILWQRLETLREISEEETS